jgi:cell division protein FtsB
MYQNKNTSVNYRNLLLNFSMALLIFYFVFHALTGNRGIFAYFRTLSAIEAQSTALQKLQDQKSLLEERLKSLHPDTFSIDALEEITKRDLGIMDESEKVIYLEN